MNHLTKAQEELRIRSSILNTSGRLAWGSQKPSAYRWHRRCTDMHIEALQRLEDTEDAMRVRGQLTWRQRCKIWLRRLN